MDSQQLRERLIDRFDADRTVARTVAREATDMADSGGYDRDFQAPLTVEAVVENMADAPAGFTLAERWNWWIRSLDLSHGGYQRFHVRRDVS